MLLAAFELTLMKEPQARRQVGDDRGRFVHRRCKRGGRTRLVMVFHEARDLVLIVEAGGQMLPYRSGTALAQAIVETLVVRVVEPLLLHGPFEVPIDLGHEAEPRAPRAYRSYRLGPEERRATSPGAREDVGQDQHRHI